MAQVTPTTKAKQEKLPQPPKEGTKKAGKTWAQKRVDQVQRSLRQLLKLKDATRRVAQVESNVKHDVRVLDHTVDTAIAAAEACQQLAQRLVETKYSPAAGVSKVAVGDQVWLRAGVWVRKYSTMYKPEELDGLTIKQITGKMALAITEGGLRVVEPVGAFTSNPVDYEAATGEEDDGGNA